MPGQATYTTKAKYAFHQQSTYLSKVNYPALNIYTSGAAMSDLPVATISLVRNDNPDWKKKISLRKDASSYYFRSGYKTDLQGVRGSIRFPQSNTSIIESTDVARFFESGSFVSAGLDTGLKDLALTRLKRKLKRHVGSFDLLVPVAEIRDLSTTVKSLANLSLELMYNLINIRKTRGRSVLKFASKAWLTYGFGVRPLLDDVDSIIKSIQKYKDRNDHFVKLTGTAKRDWVTGYTGSNVTGNFVAPIASKTRVYHTLSYRWIAGLWLNLLSANTYTQQKHFGTELPDVLPALWEYTAFSWVADYFANVGELLEDVFWTPPGDSVYVLYNRKYTASFDQAVYHVPNVLDKAIFVDRPAMQRYTYWEFERSPQPSLPHIGFRFRTVDEVAKYGVSKLLNLVSVLNSSDSFGKRQRGDPWADRGRNPLS